MTARQEKGAIVSFILSLGITAFILWVGLAFEEQTRLLLIFACVWAAILCEDVYVSRKKAQLWPARNGEHATVFICFENGMFLACFNDPVRAQKLVADRGKHASLRKKSFLSKSIESTRMIEELGISFGAIAKPLIEQVERQVGFSLTGAHREELSKLEKKKDALTQLRVSGLITDREAEAVKRRLMRRITAEVRHAIHERGQ